MNRNLQHVKQSILDVAGTWGLGIVILVIGFVVAYQFVEPAPPDRIVLATGQEGGAYQAYAKRYADWLARQGVEVEFRASAGSVENLELLDRGDVDVGLVQGGLVEAVPTEHVVAIGSLYLEPLWFFVRADLELNGVAALAGKRIAVGAVGSGTRAVVLKLLAAHGIDAQTAEFIGTSADKLADAFAANSIDAAFLIGAPESGSVSTLVTDPGVTLQSLQRAAAYVRQYSYLSPVSLPQGVLDLGTDIPPADIETVALTAMLAINEELHPALIDLLLMAATQIHGGHNLLADAGQFPTSLYIDLPLSEEAERHFRRGPPFLMQYLPFWAATLVDRLWVMLLPLIGLAIPLVKLVPQAYRWRIRQRLLRLYAELQQIDPLINPVRDTDDRAARLQRLDRLDNGSVIESVPKTYTDDVYKLRRDIDLVRRRIDKSGV